MYIHIPTYTVITYVTIHPDGRNPSNPAHHPIMPAGAHARKLIYNLRQLPCILGTQVDNHASEFDFNLGQPPNGKRLVIRVL